MIPNNCLNDVLFPHKADLYYATFTQDAWGTMISEWELNREVKCYITNVYENKTITRPMLLENQNKFQLWDDTYQVHTGENVLFDPQSLTWYTPQQTMLKNFRTLSGNEYWKGFGEDNAGDPLSFEIRGIMPILDAFGNIHSYKLLVNMSNDQDQEIV